MNEIAQIAETRMPFGKHRGKPLCEIPRNYLTWLAGNVALREPLKTAVEDVLASPEVETPKPTFDTGTIAQETVAQINAQILRRLREAASGRPGRWVGWLLVVRRATEESRTALRLPRRGFSKDLARFAEARISDLIEAGEIHHEIHGANREGFVIPKPSDSLSAFDKHFLAELLVCWDTVPTSAAGGRSASGNGRTACGAMNE